LAVALYAPAIGFDFVGFDDHAYVKENARVLSGLSWPAIRWALTTQEAANWHPLTWFSLMLDATWGGNDPRVYHATNVMLHALSAALLFLALQTMTGAAWRSALVAALHAVHPLRVESVAWIAERKDVLSGACFMAILLAYAGFARRRSRMMYALLLAAFGLGLAAKPMLVSVPLVLLILDIWPLRRPAGPLSSLVAEKLPLAAMAAASCGITLHAQSAGGAISGTELLPLGARVANALVSYGRYLEKALWPNALAVLYPHPRETIGVAPVLVALTALIALSVVAWRLRKRAPWVLVGWLWYLITLVPVIGLVQVGSQAMADRYTYIPLIGVFLAAVWSIPALAPKAVPAVASGCVAILIVLGLVTRAQLTHWRDGVSLFEHAIHVTSQNATAHDGLGMALAAQGRPDLALSHFEEALRIEPTYGGARCNLAAALVKTGRADEALRHFEEGLRLAPGNIDCRTNLGTLFLNRRDLVRAVTLLEEAVRRSPDDVSALKNLGVALAMQGKAPEAAARFEQALRLAPHDEGLRKNLERARSAPSSTR
jgi:tetratricopeptide (TPR) repeat protein